ncbi:hypothetical protein T06_7586 [Trichinella sp. T6]|nr:hypothetical protein T06_7586 [Trichinella sp. T6]
MQLDNQDIARPPILFFIYFTPQCLSFASANFRLEAIFYCVKGIITITNLCNVPFDLLSCVKLYAQQHFTSCFIVYFSLTPVLGIYFRVYFLFIAVQSRKSYPSEFQQINVD